MSSNLNLYRVLVTQEWSAEGEALVWAPDQETAEKWAKAEVEFDVWDDAEATSCCSRAKPEPLDDGVFDRMDSDRLWLIKDGNTVELDEFRAELDPERMEALRIARIEKNNGQLPLLEVAC
jgi:hypothetical protein